MDLIAKTNLDIGHEADLLPVFTPGRVVHVDADILAYILSAKNDKLKTQKGRRWAITQAALEYTQELKFETGSEFVVMHTTPSKSTKGGRFNQALLKVYQGNRKDKVKPQELTWTREELLSKDRAGVWTGFPHYNQEADDGLAQALYNARNKGEEHLAVLCSQDKDLGMCQGLHVDWDDHTRMFTVDEVGKLWIDTSGKQDKVRGNGFMWFCYQMLAGDTADDISGIPKLTQEMALKYFGSAPKNGNPKACGSKTAYKILKDMTSREELFEAIVEMYWHYGETIGFKSYAKEDITSKQAFLSEAYLLWMRETENPEDFNRFIHQSRLITVWVKYMR